MSSQGWWPTDSKTLLSLSVCNPGLLINNQPGVDPRKQMRNKCLPVPWASYLTSRYHPPPGSPSKKPGCILDPRAHSSSSAYVLLKSQSSLNLMGLQAGTRSLPSDLISTEEPRVSGPPCLTLPPGSNLCTCTCTWTGLWVLQSTQVVALPRLPLPRTVFLPGQLLLTFQEVKSS